MKFKIGDIVDNNGTTSRFKGQRGTVTHVHNYHVRASATVTVMYLCGEIEGHPSHILKLVHNIPPVKLDEDLFIL